ncbi:hypothetical protein GN244_ATG09653 [Phytophthora infestans]|uniref:Uncharacterized protein n=1 Tax=Phytophthora infestans TaxID=4787 RepID=A0A833SAM5_PHYIN|nr:hypothetical protein GN244_ATG09653 [Phytophthora infestans]
MMDGDTNDERTPAKRRRAETHDVISYLETRFGSSKEREIEEKLQAWTAVFAELEKLTSSLCSAKQAGLRESVNYSSREQG